MLEKKSITYYQVLNPYGDILATYWSYDKAKKNKPNDCTIRYWDGNNFVINVTKALDDNI